MLVRWDDEGSADRGVLMAGTVGLPRGRNLFGIEALFTKVLLHRLGLWVFRITRGSCGMAG